MTNASPIERLLWALLGVAVVAGVVHGAGRARATGRQGSNDASGLSEANLAVHADTDPFAPPGLPPGVGVDPATGRLTGWAEHLGEDETLLTWTRLDAAAEARNGADVPDDLRALHGTRVAIAGFVVPVWEVVGFRQFLLVNSTFACCYGQPPGLAGMMQIDLGDEQPALDVDPRPVVIRGRFHVEPQHLTDSPESPLVLLFRIDDATSRLLDYD